MTADGSVPDVRTLVLGGARSGKSAHAEGVVDGTGPVRYVATARTPDGDDDWAQRVAVHRARRPPHWETVEDADLVALVAAPPDGVPVLVDDLGTWLTAEIDDAGAWSLPRGTIAHRCDALADAVATHSGDLVLVTPEVGLGVVPATGSGRLFRDEIGMLNARLAQECDVVVLLVAGIPLRLR
jgi:adenosylcobinamide kinase/adenosylcobinamide-phosphate guanylyltransferase